MRSIPLTLTFDMLYRALPMMTMCVGIFVFLDVFVVLLLQVKGVDLSAQDPEALMALFRIVAHNTFFGAMAFSDTKTIRKGLFSFPITTQQLVLFQMIPAMSLSAIAVAAATCLVNFIFHVEYPVIGPALFAATLWGISFATYWHSRGAVWHWIALLVFPGAVGTWYIVRYSPFSVSSLASIGRFSFVEVMILGLLMVVSYFVAVEGVARFRCSEEWERPRFWCWPSMKDSFELPARFASASDAQCWFEWKKKHWMLTVTVACVLLVTVICWLFDGGGLKKLVSVEMYTGLFLCVLGPLAGMVLGHYECRWGYPTENRELGFGHFFSSRPISNLELARSQLQMFWKNVISAWLVWACVFVFVLMVALVSGIEPGLSRLPEAGSLIESLTRWGSLLAKAFLPSNFRWWHLAVTLPGLWAGVGMMGSLMLLGDQRRLLQVILGGEALLIGYFFFADLCLSPEFRGRLTLMLTAMIGCGLVCGSVWCAAVARQRGLIEQRTMSICIGAWLALSAVIVLEKRINLSDPIELYVFAIGVATLPFVTFASVPLAIAKNRHR